MALVSSSLANSLVNCECGGTFKLRQGPKGQFYSCSNFPNCRKTRSVIASKHISLEEKDDKKSNKTRYGTGKSAFGSIVADAVASSIMPELLAGSPEQDAIWSHILDADSHLAVDSVAGSGKSTTMVQAVLRIAQDSRYSVETLSRRYRVIIVAFNKHIATEMNTKLGALKSLIDVSARTCHSLGLGAITAYLGRPPIINRWKMRNIGKSFQKPVGVEDKDWNDTLKLAEKLAALCKNYLFEGHRHEVEAVIDKHDIEITEATESAIDMVPGYLEAAKSDVANIDYDDMLWLPVVLNMPMPSCDLLMIDEYQDTNRIQQVLCQRVNTRTVFVGDTHQAIYGFRGAGSNAINDMVEELSQSPIGCDRLNLTITRRCPSSHVDLVKGLVPHIQATPDAIKGTIRAIAKNKALAEMKAGDLVLCRTNGPLIPVAYKLLQSGIGAVVKGRSFGEGLMKLVEDLGRESIPDLQSRLREYCAGEIQRLMAKGEEGVEHMETLGEKVETLEALMNGMASVPALLQRMGSLFNDCEDGTPANAVVLGTVHRTKGLEAKRVYVLEPGLIPHPRSKGVLQMKQERNLAYIAGTRSLEELVFIGFVPEIYVMAGGKLELTKEPDDMAGTAAEGTAVGVNAGPELDFEDYDWNKQPENYDWDALGESMRAETERGGRE